MASKPKLYLITKEFPYGHGEDSFVKPEYPYLRDKFDVTVIAAELSDHLGSSKTSSQIKAGKVSVQQNMGNKFLSFVHFLMRRECYIEIFHIVKAKKKIIQRIYRMLMFGTAAETFYRRLRVETKLCKDTNAIFYFYWFDYKCFSLTMHKKRYPHIRVIARTHGYDLYDDRELYGKQFFKEQMDAKLDKLIFAAQYAKDYYLQRYHKADCGKYLLARLGVSDKGISVETRKRNHKGKEGFLLLSCSHAVDIKRVNCIIDGLSCIDDKEIQWVHIGGGDRLDALKEQAKRQLGNKHNIQFCFMGNMVNDDVIKFYQDNYVSCFITTTETEGGAPVSVQEALSFGVPVIVSAAGELSYMVRLNGYLLPVDLQAGDVGNAIEKMAELYGTNEYFDMCRDSLSIYREMFDEKVNYPKVAKEIENIC